MAQKKNGGLINRLIMGKEKSEGYARASLPSNRWELFWDIFKGRFGKLVIINLLVLLFCIPLVLLLFFRHVAILNYGTIYPFSQCFGVGYQAAFSMNGFAENIVYNVNMIVYLMLPIVVMIAAVGISGGAYVVRNMVWTEGIFVANDFWRGVKQNFRQIITIGLIFSLIFYVSVIAISLAEQSIATGVSHKWLFVTMEIIVYTMLIMFSIMTLHMVTMCVTYDLKLKQLLKNSFLFALGLLPQNLFFILLGTIPFLLLIFGGFFMGIAIILILLFGLSLFLLVWTDFSQWAYDKFVNDKVPGAQKNRGIYEKIKESDSGALKKYREQMALASYSTLSATPIKPITDDEITIAELPSSFNRNDIVKLNESKQALYEDHQRYIEEHKDDPQYQRSEADIALEKEEEERQKRIEKAKKELSKRNRK